MIDEFNPAVALIAAQNDTFRAALPFGGTTKIQGRYVRTAGVAALGLEFEVLLQLEVAGFADFTEENDPYGDHSFGAVDLLGQRVFWKIDLYDESYEYGAETPEDPVTTRRVLTLMLASEY